MNKPGRIRVYKHQIGLFVWECQHETCKAPAEYFKSGASIFWEIAQFQADAHATEWHVKPKLTPHDLGTPPGGLHFEWSDSGMHPVVHLDDLP